MRVKRDVTEFCSRQRESNFKKIELFCRNGIFKNIDRLGSVQKGFSEINCVLQARSLS